ncbi:MAG: hypothetical protein AAGL89_17180 [Pseudomonadota bacterium]
MIRSVVKLLLGPLIGLGEKYLDNQKDKERLAHGTTQAALKADAAVRQVKFSHVLGRLPLFVAEMSVAAYVAAVMIDTTWPSDLINPLELPEWFKPHFSTVLISVCGLAAVNRVVGRFR